MPFKEYSGKQLDLNEIASEIRSFWQDEEIFKKSIEQREGSDVFTFYEGPPSANGKPGVHHVLGRAIKDIFCRYKTLKGYQVHRKGGWDTHGLPVELQVEKRLGIKKEDIGDTISVADYNKECRTDVMQFKGMWEDLTERIGYWLDQDNPYVTYETDYIETLWYLLKELYSKELLYKGHTIQPYSPAAGTGLSSHELNQPGTYRSVKDVSCTAQFKLAGKENEYFLAWTTTPWTLPSNAALAVGKKITYLKVRTLNPYTEIEQLVYLAKDRLSSYFNPDGANADFGAFKKGDKVVPYEVVAESNGAELAGEKYEQLLDYVKPEENSKAFEVILGDFVSTEDGTGIVHIAPTFGADDLRVAKQQGIAGITVTDPKNPRRKIPLVDKKGRFVAEMGEFAGRYVKNYEDDPDYVSVDVDICVKLKKENKAFRVEKYEHNYPHCWRTDKPVLYYPLDSWFIKTTAFKDRLMEINKEINWKPEHTGSGRFGNWLENLVDWNLSRSRFWGTPLPIWQTEDESEYKCIGSVDELRAELEKAVAAGLMKEAPETTDLHRPYVDDMILVSDKGKPMKRVTDVIDVWFDSGAMPYAQWHYPFENKDKFKDNFPAEFIAEGVDQTRGWFFTLHAIACMLFDSKAFKNVIANGLVLDKHGNKMSKRLGNTVDPFETLDTYGADPLRWYMVHNAQPWDNLKFDLEGVDEARRKYFGTLFNTYNFFALYANLDNFSFAEDDLPQAERPEIDRWILSSLMSLIKEVEKQMEAYNPTLAVRAINDFVIDDLSNWYVRLCRRRFWKGEYSTDKISAFQTLYHCLDTVARLSAPFAPFFSDRLYRDLNEVSGKDNNTSVHLSDFPKVNENWIDEELEIKTHLAREAVSLGLGLRKKAKIKVRQPLSKVIIPVEDARTRQRFEEVADLIQSELNVKEVELMSDGSDVLVKTVKPDFKRLGPKLGNKVKFLKPALEKLSQAEIKALEDSGSISMEIDGDMLELALEDVEILNKDIPGWLVASSGGLVLALDVDITEELESEGIARELVNRVQNMRKNIGLELTDKIVIELENKTELENVLEGYKDYICGETLASKLLFKNKLPTEAEELDLNGKITKTIIYKN